MSATAPADSGVVERILIIKPSSLGDIVHALPVLAGLRERYPQAHISWLVAGGFAGLLRDHPMLDDVIPFDRRRFGRMWWNPRAHLDFWRFVRELRRRRFDLVVDLQGLFRSGFLARATGAAQRIGLADARETAWIFYSRRARCPADARHAVERNCAVADLLGLRVRPPRFPLEASPAAIAGVRELLRETTGDEVPHFIAVLPGARWPSKLWPPQRFAELIDRLHAEGRPRGVLLGAAEDRAVAGAIVESAKCPPINLVGRTTLPQLVAALALADLVVAHDSGPMHVAAALGRPIVAIFGPTDPGRTGPYAADVRIMQRSLPCAPCLRRVCPLGHHHCMELLDVAAVQRAVNDLGEAISPARPAAIAQVGTSRGGGTLDRARRC
jgi:lipopolysaccharide heptosyltransferase I